MTVIANGSEQARINVEALKNFDQQQHSDQQRLDDEATRKINDEKKTRPEDANAVAATGWLALPREVQKVIEQFALMVGIQHSLDLSVGDSKAAVDMDAATQSTDGVSNQAEQAEQATASTPYTEKSGIAFHQELVNAPAQELFADHFEGTPVDSVLQAPNRIGGAVGSYRNPASAGSASGIDFSADDSTVHATSAKMERDQRMATVTRQAAEHDKGHDADGSAQVNLAQHLGPDVIVTQAQSQQPQQSQQQRSAKSNAERSAAISAAEHQPEGLKYDLKSWGGNQSVVVTGTAQSGYQARGSDRNVERILKQHANDSLHVSIESSEAGASISSKSETGHSSSDGKSAQ